MSNKIQHKKTIKNLDLENHHVIKSSSYNDTYLNVNFILFNKNLRKYFPKLILLLDIILKISF